MSYFLIIQRVHEVVGMHICIHYTDTSTSIIILACSLSNIHMSLYGKPNVYSSLRYLNKKFLFLTKLEHSKANWVV